MLPPHIQHLTSLMVPSWLYQVTCINRRSALSFYSIVHILRVYTEWCYTCRWLNPCQYPPTEGSDSVDVTAQVVRLHVTSAKAVSGPSYCLIVHILPRCTPPVGGKDSLGNTLTSLDVAIEPTTESIVEEVSYFYDITTFHTLSILPSWDNGRAW